MTPENRDHIALEARIEFINAHRAFTTAMRTVEGPSDVVVERLRLAIAADAGVSPDQVTMGISSAKVTS